jgi:hypothetical protein
VWETFVSSEDLIWGFLKKNLSIFISIWKIIVFVKFYCQLNSVIAQSFEDGVTWVLSWKSKIKVSREKKDHHQSVQQQSLFNIAFYFVLIFSCKSISYNNYISQSFISLPLVRTWCGVNILWYSNNIMWKNIFI